MADCGDAWNWGAVSTLCLRVARNYAGGEQDAQDIAQEATLRAWRHRAQCRDAEAWAAWTAQIARNEALRWAARRVPEPVAELPATPDAGPDVDGRLDLGRALATLSPRDRLLTHLRYEQDMTYSAIASLLDLPEGTVKVRLHRARRMLAQALEHP